MTGGMDTGEQQAFWNDFMRRPDAKAAYQADLALNQRKAAWLLERHEIEQQRIQRQTLADALEAAPADVKKLIAPMFHIRVVAQFLWMVFDECQKTNTCFLAKLQAGDRTLEHLKRLREQFHEGGEERMENLEKQWTAICTEIYVEEEKKREEKPARIDIHTLKHVLEFGQECKRLGNEKFREGLYEEALQIYSQGDELMKKWCCSDQWKNESKWLKDYHLACLKNKAQAALRLEMFSTALEAAEAALRLDVEDHKSLVPESAGLQRLRKIR